MANAFTPEQIAQILEEFFKTVGTRQYIGARYVPLFGRKDETSIEWDNSKPYEPLTVVLYLGNSYTSRQYVPAGVQITNEEFWAITGNYNAQIEEYRRETARSLQAAQDAKTSADNAQNDIDTLLPKSDFSSENTVKDYIDGAVQEVQNDVDTLLPKSAFSAENTVKNYIDSEITASYKNLTDSREPIHIDRIIDNDNDTFCFVVKVPRKDYYIDIVGGTGLKTNDDPDYAVKIADRSEITTNCNLVGVCVIGGNRIRERVSASEYFQVLGFDADGNATLFTDPQTTTQQIINAGCVDGFGIWGCLIKEGAKYPIASVITDPDNPYYGSLVNVYHIRDGLGIDENYWYYFVVLGRLTATYGATWETTQDILFKYNAGADWYMFDGGGSAQCYTKDGNNLVPYSDSGEGMNETRSRRMYMTFKERQNA